MLISNLTITHLQREERTKTTHRLFHLFIKATLAHQAELVLGVIVRQRAGGAIHLCSGACVDP